MREGNTVSGQVVGLRWRMRLWVAALAAAVTSVLSVSAVAAGQPFMERFTVNVTADEVICGIPVTAHGVASVVHVVRTDKPFIDIHVGTVTYTNADGDWVEVDFRGPTMITETLNPDGTFTVTLVNSGMQERLTTSTGHGPTAAWDRGRVERILTVDLGDPEDPEDDAILSMEVAFAAGPHPDLDSDFALFCEVFVAALG